MKLIKGITNIKKNFVWNTIGSLLYSFTSLFFLIIVTRINGINDAGIFSYGFSFACMVQVIALFGGRTYQATEMNKNITDKDYVFFKIICCLLMFIIGVFYTLVRGYNCYKIIIIVILIIYKMLDAFAESYYGVFQKNNNLYQCGVSLTLKASLCTIVFWVTDIFTNNLTISLILLLITDIMVLCFYDSTVIKRYNLKSQIFKPKSITLLFKGGLSVCIFFLLTQYIVNTQKYVIDFTLTNSDQTIFGIIIMPATFMTLCAVFIFNPFTTKINSYIKNNYWMEFRKLINKICLWIICIGIAVLIICCVIGIPILNFIYNINLEGYFWHLLIIIAGSIFYAIVTILSNALISLRKNVVQMLIFIIGAIFSTLVSVLFIMSNNLFGASIAYSGTMLFLLVMYIIVYLIEIKRIENGK